MLGNRGSPEARSRLCIMLSLLPHDLCHGQISSRWLPAERLGNMPVGCLSFLQGAVLPRMLCRRLPGLGAKCCLEVFFQGLVPLSWGCDRKPKHTGEGQNHIHMSLLGSRARGNLSLSGTFLARTESYSGCDCCTPHPGALGAEFSLGSAESVRPSNSLRIHPVALPFPLTELSLL